MPSNQLAQWCDIHSLDFPFARGHAQLGQEPSLGCPLSWRTMKSSYRSQCLVFPSWPALFRIWTGPCSFSPTSCSSVFLSASYCCSHLIPQPFSFLSRVQYHQGQPQALMRNRYHWPLAKSCRYAEMILPEEGSCDLKSLLYWRVHYFCPLLLKCTCCFRQNSFAGSILQVAC